MPAAIRYLDLIILAIALPIFIVAGWPLGGYAAAAIAWLAQRAINDYTSKRAAASDDPKTVVGLTAGVDDRTRMARSPYDLRRVPDRRKR